MKVALVFGARPNFMKVAPIVRVLDRDRHTASLIHTGQHFDPQMSDRFFEDLDLRRPDVHLGIGGGTPTAQLGEMILALETYLASLRPDAVVVVGDVTSTLAGALAGSIGGTGVAHVEAGLRSYDRDMPEERNRVLTDHIADFLFTPSLDANANLEREGIPRERIFFVGNVMVDSLDWMMRRLDGSDAAERFGVRPKRFGLVTLHRPATVDDPSVLRDIIETLDHISAELDLVFPVHPRTRARLDALADGTLISRMRLVEPLRYPEFIGLLADSRLVLTDSGGIQEEATVLGVPCLTLRENTERPITVTMGSNQVVGLDRDAIFDAIRRVLSEATPAPVRPEYWDGRAAERIVTALAEALER